MRNDFICDLVTLGQFQVNMARAAQKGNSGFVEREWKSSMFFLDGSTLMGGEIDILMNTRDESRNFVLLIEKEK
jgi:hypothetical protein